MTVLLDTDVHVHYGFQWLTTADARLPEGIPRAGQEYGLSGPQCPRHTGWPPACTPVRYQGGSRRSALRPTTRGRTSSMCRGSSPAFGTRLLSSKLDNTRLRSCFARAQQMLYLPATPDPSTRSSSQLGGHLLVRQAATDPGASDPGSCMRSFGWSDPSVR